MKLAISLIFVAVVAGVGWFVAPQYLFSEQDFNANTQIAQAGNPASAQQKKSVAVAAQKKPVSGNSTSPRKSSKQVSDGQHPATVSKAEKPMSARVTQVRDGVDDIDARLERLDRNLARLLKSKMVRDLGGDSLLPSAHAASQDMVSSETKRPAKVEIPSEVAKAPEPVTTTAMPDALSKPQVATRPEATAEPKVPNTQTAAVTPQAIPASQGVPATQSPPSWRPLLGCVIEPDQAAEVGSPVVGVVASLHIERGARVKRGQVLARLRSNVERAAVEVARVRSEADAELRAATANLDFLRQKRQRAEDLVAVNFVSKQALEQALADESLAVERLAQAHEQQRVWGRELKLANAQLQMRTIRAPFDGVIVNRYVAVGERIEDEPLFRIIKTHPLRVEVVAPSTMFGTVSMGTAVSVTPELPNAPALLAKVVLVDSVIDGASNTFRLRATLPNPDGALPSGLRCQAKLGDRPATAAETLPGKQDAT